MATCLLVHRRMQDALGIAIPDGFELSTDSYQSMSHAAFYIAYVCARVRVCVFVCELW